MRSNETKEEIFIDARSNNRIGWKFDNVFELITSTKTTIFFSSSFHFDCEHRNNKEIVQKCVLHLFHISLFACRLSSVAYDCLPSLRCQKKCNQTKSRMQKNRYFISVHCTLFFSPSSLCFASLFISSFDADWMCDKWRSIKRFHSRKLTSVWTTLTRFWIRIHRREQENILRPNKNAIKIQTRKSHSSIYLMLCFRWFLSLPLLRGKHKLTNVTEFERFRKSCSSEVRQELDESKRFNRLCCNLFLVSSISIFFFAIRWHTCGIDEDDNSKSKFFN